MTLDRFLENFDLLFNTPNAVDILRSLLLELAIQGKLVPQEKGDEPASALIDRIRKEKTSSGETISQKKSSTQSKKKGATAFNIPNNWIWAQLEDVTLSVQYGFTASADKTITDPRLLRITDIQNNKVNWESVPGCEIEPRILPNYKLKVGDILIARTGGTIGKTYLIEDLPVQAVFASYLIRVVPSTLMLPRYLKLFAESPFYWKQLYAKSMGTGQPNVNGTALKALYLPIPPYAEQIRIAAKVSQLMELCNEFEAKMLQASEDAEKLLKATVNQLLNEAEPSEIVNNIEPNNLDLSNEDEADPLVLFPENANHFELAPILAASNED